MLYAFNEILISNKKKALTHTTTQTLSQLKNIMLSKRGQIKRGHTIGV